MSNRIHRTQFGNLVGLRPIPSSNNNNNLLSVTEEPSSSTIPAARLRKCTRNSDKNTTKTMQISGQLYQRFLDHSSKYYNVESYETILEDLLDSFDKHNQDKRWYNNNTNNNNKD